MGSIAITPAEVIGALNDVESKYAPSQLFLAGNSDLLRGGRRVSVIGSRKASSQGLRRARVIARSLVGHGIVVVSGLAAGIDRAAHEAAIASGGQTMAVIGTPNALVADRNDPPRRPDPVTREPGDCMGESARIHSTEHHCFGSLSASNSSRSFE